MRVVLRPTVPESAEIRSCSAQFEDYGVVTQSVRQGIDVQVSVDPYVEAQQGPTS